jgi:YVTN family beta-propeller protein
LFVGLAWSPDGSMLYVPANGAGTVSAVDTATLKVRKTLTVGSHPTSIARNPTTVTLTRDGSQLLVTNAKGLGAGPNPGDPDPTKPGVDYGQYSASMVMGTLSDIKVPGRDTLEHYTRQVRANDRFDADDRQARRRSVVPVRPGDASPIKHVVYVVRENRAYDQVFGSLGKGNGDPSLNLFGHESAPNQRKLARDFVTLDNFYVDGAVSSDGWEWATASESNSDNEHLWPVAYGGRGRGDDVYTNPATDPGKITEDDAQNGPDHVDAHRTTSLVVSPYTERGRVDSTMYSTVSMMRTMELLAGIGPLTRFDAAATPMAASFGGRPDLNPYTGLTPAQRLDELNSATSPMAAQSAEMNLSEVDKAPEQLLNEAI